MRSKKMNKVIANATLEQSQLTRQALDMGHEAIKSLQETVAIGREAVKIASGAVALASAMSEKVKTMPLGDVLSGEELAVFAETIPQWSVSTGVVDGRAFKSYERVIHADEMPVERRAGGVLERDTYLSLADVEHSDFGLAQIFDTYNFSGDYINGDYYRIRISAEESGPLTYQDFSRVLDAEAYLVTAGYILPKSNEPTEATLAG